MKKNYENLSQFRLSSNTHKKENLNNTKKTRKRELNWIERALNCVVSVPVPVQYNTISHLLDQGAGSSWCLLVFTFFMGICNSVSCKWKIWFINPFSLVWTTKIRITAKSEHSHTAECSITFCVLLNRTGHLHSLLLLLMWSFKKPFVLYEIFNGYAN